MKIRLYMFSEPCGKVRDIPENSTTTFKMVLYQPPTVIRGVSGEKVAERPPLNTVCEFEWTGMFESDSGARVYNLVDIIKT